MCRTISKDTSASQFGISSARGEWRRHLERSVWAAWWMLCIVDLLSLCVVGYQTFFKKISRKMALQFHNQRPIGDSWPPVCRKNLLSLTFSLCSCLYRFCTSKRMYIFVCAPRFIPVFRRACIRPSKKHRFSMHSASGSYIFCQL